MSRAPIENIDVVIGKRLRALRNALKISQGKLGEDVGISFQQVQKYERGSNRISASRLYTIAKALGVDVNVFYEDFLGDASGDGAAGGLAEAGASYRAGPEQDDDVRELLEAFSRIRTPALRASVLQMARSIAENERPDGPVRRRGRFQDGSVPSPRRPPRRSLPPT